MVHLEKEWEEIKQPLEFEYQEWIEKHNNVIHLFIIYRIWNKDNEL